MRTNKRKLVLLAAIPVLVGGWALFRPELLFINQSVNEKLPTMAGQTVSARAAADFVSYAHETTGRAEILDVNGKSILRLSNFKTSNGPDVHLYLVKGNDPKAVKDGSYLDLGSIKGNIGDQNYELPAGTDLSDYGSVNVWCKRFSVGFGGASFRPSGEKMTMTSRRSELPVVQTVALSEEIRVTAGKFRTDTPGVKGSAELVERNGQRFLRLKGVKAPGAAIEVFIVKQETVAPKADLAKFTKVRLGTLNPKAGTQEFPVSKDLDAWLYRSVTLWDAAKKQSVSSAPLRSDQEKTTTILFA